jgi:hypothetical protein
MMNKLLTLILMTMLANQVLAANTALEALGEGRYTPKINLGVQVLNTSEVKPYRDSSIEHSLEPAYTLSADIHFPIVSNFMIGAEFFYSDLGHESVVSPALHDPQSHEYLGSKEGIPAMLADMPVVKYKAFGMRFKPMYVVADTFYLAPMVGFARHSVHEVSSNLASIASNTRNYSWDMIWGGEIGMFFNEHWVVKAGYQAANPSFEHDNLMLPKSASPDFEPRLITPASSFGTFYVGVHYQI